MPAGELQPVHRSQAEQLDADRVEVGGLPDVPGTKDALFGAFDYTPDKDVASIADEARTRSPSPSIS